MRGRRPEMQDTISVLPYAWKEDGRRMVVLGMFDGHGSCQSSQVVAESLEGLINATTQRRRSRSEAEFHRNMMWCSDQEICVMFQKIYWKLQVRLDRMYAQQPAPRLDMGTAASIVLVCEGRGEGGAVAERGVVGRRGTVGRRSMLDVERGGGERERGRRRSNSCGAAREGRSASGSREGASGAMSGGRDVVCTADLVDSVCEDNYASGCHRFSNNLNPINERQGPIPKEKPRIKTSDASNSSSSGGERRAPDERTLLVVTNCGDQRVVLYNGDESAYLQTSDHKPGCEQERMRIYREGGFVAENRRSCGILALSRSLGDSSLQPYVTYQPDIHVYRIEPHKDAFVIIACDGIWDVMSSRKAIQIAKRDLGLPDFPCRAAARIRNYAYSLNSSDNLSVIVYKLGRERQGHART
ncbi:uncharacterized protein LOC126322613 [Schistocerca gregaria]|uniref:uncharacterized protein LOC126322613 n=1 Tax=Schistocerca gregaria TaxID=7010 RepID=UPI00211E9456|nr:uncharacterized protein LOC126322613 [Schistocerca gregaria]